jgi:putative RecB family exonuclease
MTLANYNDRLPVKLSPSRAKDYQQCPKLFYYKTILGLQTPPTEATARGTVAHHAFEHIFDHPKGERTPEVALTYIRPAWEVMINPLVDRSSVEKGSPEYIIREKETSFRDLHEPGSSSELKLVNSALDYIAIIPLGSDAETKFINSIETAVKGWFFMEDPNVFEPTFREKYISAFIGKAPVHGYIDRIDETHSGDTKKVWISDYKTGKVPNEKYREEAFFQLAIYALLVQATTGETPFQLRLIYVNEGHKDAVLKRDVDFKLLNDTKLKINSTWDAILKSAKNDTWKPRKQVLCGWCHFQNICPAFNSDLESLLPEEIEFRGTV